MHRRVQLFIWLFILSVRIYSFNLIECDIYVQKQIEGQTLLMTQIYITRRKTRVGAPPRTPSPGRNTCTSCVCLCPCSRTLVGPSACVMVMKMVCSRCSTGRYHGGINNRRLQNNILWLWTIFDAYSAVMMTMLMQWCPCDNIDLMFVFNVLKCRVLDVEQWKCGDFACSVWNGFEWQNTPGVLESVFISRTP